MDNVRVACNERTDGWWKFDAKTAPTKQNTKQQIANEKNKPIILIYIKQSIQQVATERTNRVAIIVCNTSHFFFLFPYRNIFMKTL